MRILIALALVLSGCSAAIQIGSPSGGASKEAIEQLAKNDQLIGKALNGVAERLKALEARK